MSEHWASPDLSAAWKRPLAVACEAAEEAGARLAEWAGSVRAALKGPRDLVTEADLEAQRLIRDRLLGAFPSHDFLGEEGEKDGSRAAGKRARGEGGPTWVVDPLDGTTNYVHGLPYYAVAIAWVERGVVRLGVIHEPATGATYWAVRGQGAWRGNERLRVSDCRDPEGALVAVSLPARVARNSPAIDRLLHLIDRTRAIRRLGSAALNLAYLAGGRLDGYWSDHGMPWDVAAGCLLVREAGGVVLDAHGNPFDVAQPGILAASTPGLARRLLDAIGTPGTSA